MDFVWDFNKNMIDISSKEFAKRISWNIFPEFIRKVYFSYKTLFNEL